MSLIEGLKDALAFWRPKEPEVPFAVLFKKFQSILDRNNKILERMADMGDKLGGEYVFDQQYIHDACESMGDLVFKLISDLSVMSRRASVELFIAFERIRRQIQEELAGRRVTPGTRLTIGLNELSRDQAEEAGEKLAHLGDLKNVLGLKVPNGFAITAKAFLDFVEHNGLRAPIDEAAAELEAGGSDERLEALSERIRSRILDGRVPRPVAAQVRAWMDVLAMGRDKRGLRFAVRSSAWGEDGETSFAGQYESVLGVPADGVLDAYKKVLASAYAPEAWRYRLRRGYREHETAMAVGCQLMIEAEASGGLYTYAPLSQGEAWMVVNGVWGLGASVMDGTAEADSFILERKAPHALRSVEIGRKSVRLAASPSGGVAEEAVPDPLQNVVCLSPDRLERLVREAMRIERYYKRPQDIEWAFDAAGELHILQARPLDMRSRLTESSPGVDVAALGAEVLFSGKGAVAQRGVASGKVFVVRPGEDLSAFPYGAILVAKFASPRFSRIMDKAQGIITDIGSPAGHMGTLARERRVPTVVNVGAATSLLKTGDEITLDASQNIVYRGAVAELSRFELTEEDVFEDAYEYRLLRRLLKRITPLNLVDPHSEEFRPSACRTYHDITRFIHEKAVEELVHLSENSHKRLDATPRRLLTEIPLGLMVIDVEDGLGTSPDRSASGASGGANRSARTEDVASVPLKALLQGLSELDMWATEPVSVDLGSFMSSFTRTFSAAQTAPANLGRNLAVISRDYMNLNLRLGYHYTIIDAYIHETVNDNYIYFRFLGGVTDVIRRSRRARFIAEVLDKLDFRTEVRGDLIVARAKKLAMERMIMKMKMLGGLVGYTRQLDVRMHSDEHLAWHVEEFMRRVEPLLASAGGAS